MKKDQKRGASAKKPLSKKQQKALLSQNLSKKQRKKLEKQGVVFAKGVAEPAAPRAPRIPREKKLFVALLAAILVVAIVCATFGGILLARVIEKASVHPHASVYETLTMKNYLATRKMGKKFYTGNTFDVSGIESYYAAKDAAYMDEYVKSVLLENRTLVANGQKETAIGYADDVSMYIIGIYKGAPGEDGFTRIPPTVMPYGSYTTAQSLTVGYEFFGKDFDDKLIALGVKPVDTGREVRYGGDAALEDTLCITFSLYKKSGNAKDADGKELVTDDLLKKYTFSSSKEMLYSRETARVCPADDLEATLAAALVDNCPALGEDYSFVLENYSPAGDGSNPDVYKVEAMIHFVVTEEKYQDVTFNFPEQFFNSGDGAELLALNGEKVTFRVIFAGSNDYELPKFDRKFITETLKMEITATDDEGAVQEYKTKMLAKINEQRATTSHEMKIRQAYLNLAEKAQSNGLFVSTDYSSSLKSDIWTSAYNSLINRFLSAYGYYPSTAEELNAIAKQAAYEESNGAISPDSITDYSQYLDMVVQSRISQEIIMYYIFDHAGLEVPDEAMMTEYEEYLAELVADAENPEVHNREYFIKQLGGENALLKQIRRNLVYEIVGEFLLEQNSLKLR